MHTEAVLVTCVAAWLKSLTSMKLKKVRRFCLIIQGSGLHHGSRGLRWTVTLHLQEAGEMDSSAQLSVSPFYSVLKSRLWYSSSHIKKR